MLLTAAMATWFDLRERRIPNWLCGAAFLAGVVWHWRDGLAGAGLAAAIYGTLFLLRGVGAGDVKLMMALGALAGPMPWLIIFTFSAIAGGVHAIVLIIKGGKTALRQKKPLAPAVLAGCLAWAIPLLSR
ncbi:MAG: A24 family peptidase [Acidobacteria bacterium]|nr:A24 family peptidase [Acidobacteriota bacterium]